MRKMAAPMRSVDGMDGRKERAEDGRGGAESERRYVSTRVGSSI